MDFLKNNVAGGHQGAAAGHHRPQGGERMDIGDKIFHTGAQKSGHPVNRHTGEKITDGVRGVFEKATGKKVNPKISN